MGVLKNKDVRVTYLFLYLNAQKQLSPDKHCLKSMNPPKNLGN